MNRPGDTRTFRVEEDAFGNVEVPADHLWGAQTERSRHNFPIGVERYRWGRPVIRAAIFNHRTTLADIDAFFEDATRIAAEIAAAS